MLTESSDVSMQLVYDTMIGYYNCCLMQVLDVTLSEVQGDGGGACRRERRNQNQARTAATVR